MSDGSRQIAHAVGTAGAAFTGVNMAASAASAFLMGKQVKF